ncbi:response regulator [Devosia sp.]|uniref:response regulator n=1 Tax=Devosia sp. TaxID=1871048 RepID=UPI002732ACFF|nr:response regulator [Devosia sp.]MDP2782727.1 response regulator [Devosia sp.]
MAAFNVPIVEDEWLIARDYASAIHAGGHVTIGPAQTVARALAMLDTERVDIAILDYQLGAETSASVVARLNKNGIAFLVVTGHAIADLPPEFAAGKMAAKPADPHWLKARIEQLATHLPR